MISLTRRSWQTMMGCLALTACGGMSMNTPAAPVYDVRSAVVLSSSAAVAPELLSATGERLNAAIATTVRPAPLPHVILTVRIVSVELGKGFQSDRNIAHVDVNAASVDSGEVIAVSSFDVTSIAQDPSLATDVLAEDIAARIRSLFSLTRPQSG